MKFLYAMAGIGAVAGGVHYSGVLDRGEVYAKPYSVVYAELVSMPLPTEVESFAGADEVRMTQAPDQIEWHFRDDRGEIAVFSAHLSKENARHTRVKVDFKTGDGLDESSGRLLSTELIRSTARSAMAEQLDARLSGRAYDSQHMAQILGEHLRDHPEEMKQYGENLDQIFKEAAASMKMESEGGSGSSSADFATRTASTNEAMDEATRPTVTVFPQ